MEKKSCRGFYGSYDSLNDAISYCEADSDCDKVYDENCDSQGVYQLCTTGTKVKQSKSRSCVYRRASGNYTN